MVTPDTFRRRKEIVTGPITVQTAPPPAATR
jgi:hypothetical protein